MYMEDNQKYNQLIIAFTGNCITVLTMQGTKLAYLETPDALIDFTNPQNTEDTLFGALSDSGLINIYHY